MRLVGMLLCPRSLPPGTFRVLFTGIFPFQISISLPLSSPLPPPGTFIGQTGTEIIQKLKLPTWMAPTGGFSLWRTWACPMAWPLMPFHLSSAGWIQVMGSLMLPGDHSHLLVPLTKSWQILLPVLCNWIWTIFTLFKCFFFNLKQIAVYLPWFCILTCRTWNNCYNCYMTSLKRVTDSYFGGYVGVLLRIELGV